MRKFIFGLICRLVGYIFAVPFIVLGAWVLEWNWKQVIAIALIAQGVCLMDFVDDKVRELMKELD